MRKNIDAAWFQEQADKSPLGSLRKLATAIQSRQGPMHPAALVRSIHGTREFTLSEIEQIANLLNVPILEVLRRCGVDLKAGQRPRRREKT